MHFMCLYFNFSVRYSWKCIKKINRIEIIIHLLSWLIFVICGFIKNFLPNSYFIFQIYHAKSFKKGHVTSLYFNFSVRYSLNSLKTQIYYPDLIDFQYDPLTYSLWLLLTRLSRTKNKGSLRLLRSGTRPNDPRSVGPK